MNKFYFLICLGTHLILYLAPLYSATPIIFSGGLSTAGIGGIILLGALSAKAATLAASNKARNTRTYGRRSAEINPVDEEGVWNYIEKVEEEECTRRVICEIATGSLISDTFSPIVELLLQEDLYLHTNQAVYPYISAAKRGYSHKNQDKCQTQFKCPDTASEILEKADNFH